MSLKSLILLIATPQAISSALHDRKSFFRDLAFRSSLLWNNCRRHTGIVVFGKEYFYGGMGIEFCDPVRQWNAIKDTPNNIVEVFLDVFVSGWHHNGPASQG